MTRCIRLYCEVLVLLTMVDMGWSQSWHFTGDNIALNKPTEQRPGTATNFRVIPSSELAVDGNRHLSFESGSCTHTTSGLLNTTCYWSVDLGDTYFVKGIRIYHRDEGRYALDYFTIVGYPVKTTLHDDATAVTKLARKAIIDIPVPATQFSNITITRPAIPDNTYPLILCEVEVYGVSELNFCPSVSTDDQLIWSVSYGFIDTERNLVVEDSIVEFSCPSYYTLGGAAVVTCLSTGRFNASIPRCLETPCERPSTISNGAYSAALKTQYSYYETVTWTCSDGYKSNQNRTRQCLPTSEWSGTNPVCTLIGCLYPSGLTNGELMYPNGSIHTSSQGKIPSGTMATVACDDCFMFNTDTTLCTQNEVWSIAPKCTQVVCTNIGSFTGGQYSYNKGAIQGNYACGTVATVSCYAKFKKIFDTRKCGQDGSWSGTDTQPCERICTAPPEIANGSYNEVLETDYSVGDILVWHCLEGYKSDQNRTRQCLDTSAWSGTGASCTLIACTFPIITPEVSLTSDDGTVYAPGPIPSRTIVNVNCDECFEFNVANITCGLDEEWNTIPTCSFMECNSLGRSFFTYKDMDGNALNSADEKYACGTVVEINCGANYYQAADTLTCGETKDSSWSGTDVPCVNLLSGPSFGPPVAIIGGVMAAAVVVGAVTGVAVFLLLRRRMIARERSQPTSTQGPGSVDDTENHTYTDLTGRYDNTGNTESRSDTDLTDRHVYTDLHDRHTDPSEHHEYTDLEDRHTATDNKDRHTDSDPIERHVYTNLILQQ